MKKIIVGGCAAAALLVSAVARSEAIVIGYDIVHGLEQKKTGWSSFYTGTVTKEGGGTGYTYSGGGGTLNDGVVAANNNANNNNMMFNIPRPPNSTPGPAQYSPIITLHLSGTTVIDNIDFFASVFNTGSHGGITGATITIGGVSQALNSIGWGPVCDVRSQTLCNDRFSLLGTTLAGLSTDTIVFSDFKSSYPAFAFGEVTVDGSAPIVSLPVPEPHTYTMLLAGLALTGWAARRRKRV